MNLSTWGDLGNIILGITSVFTAIVTAVVLCKQHKLQQEQHKLEQEKLNFTIPVTDQPREKVAKLVQTITDRVPVKLKGVKGNDPEYWGLAATGEGPHGHLQQWSKTASPH